jgi:hypothetical protein
MPAKRQSGRYGGTTPVAPRLRRAVKARLHSVIIVLHRFGARFAASTRCKPVLLGWAARQLHARQTRGQRRGQQFKCHPSKERHPQQMRLRHRAAHRPSRLSGLGLASTASSPWRWSTALRPAWSSW